MAMNQLSKTVMNSRACYLLFLFLIKGAYTYVCILKCSCVLKLKKIYIYVCLVQKDFFPVSVIFFDFLEIFSSLKRFFLCIYMQYIYIYVYSIYIIHTLYTNIYIIYIFFYHLVFQNSSPDFSKVTQSRSNLFGYDSCISISRKLRSCQ